MRTQEAELAITTSFLRRTLSLVGVRAQARLLLGRLEVIVLVLLPPHIDATMPSSWREHGPTREGLTPCAEFRESQF